MGEQDTEKLAQERIGTVINGKWTVDRLIGVGGMASVYSATHRNSKRAALKIMHPELSAQAAIRERFLREGYLSNMVDHPGVVSVDDDDVTEDGCAFLVMELVEGETLEARLRRKGPLPPEEVLSFMDQVLHALATAHTRGVVHRDLKPENMLLARNGEVKLLDFGIARARALCTDPTKTLTEGLMGTPAFMPPEQARGRWEEVDAQSDVWALGATMFTLLTGRNVHQAATTNEALAVAMMRKAPQLEEYRPDLPASVLELVNTALAYDKKDRWPNATVMLLAVRRASGRLCDEEVEAQALAAMEEVQRSSEPEVFFSEGDDELTAVHEPASEAQHLITPLPDDLGDRDSQEPPTNPVSSRHPFPVEADAAREKSPAGDATQAEAPQADTPQVEAAPQPVVTEAPRAKPLPPRPRPRVPRPDPSSAPTRVRLSKPLQSKPNHDTPLSGASEAPEAPALTHGEHGASDAAIAAAASWAGAEASAEPPSSTETSAPLSQPPPASPQPAHSSADSIPPPSTPVPPESGEDAVNAYLDSNPASGPVDGLPARRVVPFSDVPLANPEMPRPTETTTARSALTSKPRVPSRSQWSMIGGGVVALVLLVALLSSLGGKEPSSEPPELAAQAASAVPSAPVIPEPVADEVAGDALEKADAPAESKPEPASNPVEADDEPRGESVDLETLPMLPTETGQPVPPPASVAAPAHVVPAAPRAAAAAPKTRSNIFNKAKNLAVERATKRSGDKPGSQ